MNVFQKIRNLSRMEERQRWAVERQMAKCTRITPVYSSTPKGGGGGQRMEEDVILLGMLKEQYGATRSELDAARAAIAPRVRRLQDGNQRTAMTMRYMKNMRIMEIGDAMGYSERQVFRILERAEAIILKGMEREERGKKDGSTCQAGS